MKDLEVKRKMKNFLKNFKEPKSSIRVTDIDTLNTFYTLIDNYKIYTDCEAFNRDIKTEHEYNLGSLVPYCTEDSDIEQSDLSNYMFDKDISFDFEEVMNIDLLEELYPLLKTVLNYYSNVAQSVSILLKEVEFDIESLQDRLNLGGILNFINYAKECGDCKKSISIMKSGLTGYYMALYNAFDIIKKDKEFRFLFMAPFKYLFDVFVMDEDLINKMYDTNPLEELPENPYSYLALYLSLDDFKYHVDLYKSSEDRLVFNKGDYKISSIIVVGFVSVDVATYWANVGEISYIKFFNNMSNTVVKIMSDRNIDNLCNTIDPSKFNKETRKAFLLSEVLRSQLKNIDVDKFIYGYM